MQSRSRSRSRKGDRRCRDCREGASSWRPRFVWAGVELDETLNAANSLLLLQARKSTTVTRRPGLFKSVEKAGRLSLGVGGRDCAGRRRSPEKHELGGELSAAGCEAVGILDERALRKDDDDDDRLSDHNPPQSKRGEGQKCEWRPAGASKRGSGGASRVGLRGRRELRPKFDEYGIELQQ